MIELNRTQLHDAVEDSDLFREVLQLPDARRYRQMLERSRAWRLQPGETIPEPAHRTGAYAVLSGLMAPDAESAAALSAPLAEGEEASDRETRRIYGQWTGLRGLPLADAPVAASDAVVLECDPALLHLLLGEAASQFKIEFYRPLVRGVEPIADTPPDVLDEVIRKSKFATHASGSPIVRQGEFGSTMFFILAGEAAVQSPAGTPIILRQNDFFGEIAVLAYQPRGADVLSAGDCLVMESDRDAVGDLRKKSKTFKALVEQRYRERAMISTLQSTPFFQGLESDELESIRDIGTLESFDPYEVIFFQGEEADALYLVLNGTMTVVEETPEGALPIAWVRSGETVGELALLSHVSGTNRRQQTVTSLQRVDAIRIPAAAFQQIMRDYPSVGQKLEATARQRLAQNETYERDEARSVNLGWMLETQHVAGNWVLSVDMNDCIRCNNCVTACQSTHADGLTRFFWSNMRQDEDVMPHVRFSNSCQHCEFAPCMKVCPTNALKRESQAGAVFIDYDLCIRCGKCADPSQGCPYGSIYVVPTDQVSREPEVPFWKQWLSKLQGAAPASAAPDAKAGKNYPVKCDLCNGLPYQACVHHCPTGAVFRIDGDRQFGEALARPNRNGGNKPSGETVQLYVHAAFEEPPLAGRPSELVVTIKDEGPGLPVQCRRPEQGVAVMKLNMYLSAPDSLRIGGGGPLRQLILPIERLAGETDYAMTSRTPGKVDLELSVYQGGLFLGHTPVDAEFVKG
jgi:Fe-S-cluster-containing dehydrogenase component/CRP-like cAMP-binding protein